MVNEYENRVMVGETDDIAFYGTGDDELQLNFNFPLMRTNRFTPQHVRANQEDRLSTLPKGAWPCNTLGNHDSPRMRSQYGDGVHDDAIARVNLMMLLTLKGTPFLYNGEEFGMSNVHIHSLKDFVDPIGITYYHLEKELMGSNEETAIRIAAEHSRDKGRNPLQWSSGPNGGFCPAGVNPWLPVNPDFADGVNYEDEVRHGDSTWNYYRSLIAWRKESPALMLGEQEFIETGNDALLGYTRSLAGEVCLVLLNMGNTDLTFEDDSLIQHQTPGWFATETAKVSLEQGKVNLSAHAGVIIKTTH